MGLLDSLPNSNLGLKGQAPPLRAGALKSSPIHNPDSFPDQSDLDLDGKTPQKYVNNLPR
jgi:hypothetical protein